MFQIYRQLADDEPMNQSQYDLDDSVRESQTALLTKARDALYITMDRIRGNRLHVSTNNHFTFTFYKLYGNKY